jgi:hypothetical protein
MNPSALAGSTDLPDHLKSMEREFATYRRELPRLLQEGHAGRYALIKEDQILSIWDTQRDVLQAGYERFGLELFTLKKIDPRDVERLALLGPPKEAQCQT